ncbi:hypothetical protein CR513_49517, partial [Mucuna pruriens]
MLKDAIYGGKERSMRRREGEVWEFRTPQHPSLGTNNWGGASPLLARNIPKESLEQKYTKLNTVRTRDEIFTVDDYSETGTSASASAKRWNKGNEITQLRWVHIPRREGGYPDWILQLSGQMVGVDHSMDLLLFMSLHHSALS